MAAARCDVRSVARVARAKRVCAARRRGAPDAIPPYVRQRPDTLS